MDNLLEEYKAYYAARAERFADNPNYKFSYEAEKNLSEAMQSCSTLEEFKEKVGNLNELCAIALVKDEAIIEKNFYEKHQEFIRKLAPERIFAKADNYDNVMDLISMVTEETNKNSIEISMDEAHRQLLYDWKLLDNIEVYENAEVPEKYKKEMLETAQESREAIIRNVTDIEKNNESWQAGWRLTPDLITEHRHQRLFPYNDNDLQEQLAKYKSIINR